MVQEPLYRLAQLVLWRCRAARTLSVSGDTLLFFEAGSPAAAMRLSRRN